MRSTVFALTAALVLASAPSALAGDSGPDLTGTWEGKASCTYEGDPDEKAKFAIDLRIVAFGPFLAAELEEDGTGDEQPLCGYVQPDANKPLAAAAINFNPFNFGLDPLFGPYPMAIAAKAKVTPSVAKLKGKGIMIFQMTKGGLGVCKLKVKRIDTAEPSLGKVAESCAPI